MGNALVRVKTVHNRRLDDDDFVNECMESMVERYPQITGWMYERIDADHIQILMWGDNFEIAT